MSNSVIQQNQANTSRIVVSFEVCIEFYPTCFENVLLSRERILNQEARVHNDLHGTSCGL